jgi:hypothetical protein
LVVLSGAAMTRLGRYANEIRVAIICFIAAKVLRLKKTVPINCTDAASQSIRRGSQIAGSITGLPQPVDEAIA